MPVGSTQGGYEGPGFTKKRRVRRKPNPVYRSTIGASKQTTKGAKKVRRKVARQAPPKSPAQAVKGASRQITKGAKARERQAHAILLALKRKARQEARGIHTADVGEGPGFVERALDFLEPPNRTPSFDDDLAVKATREILRLRREHDVRGGTDSETNKAIAELIKHPGRTLRKAAAAHSDEQLGKMGVGPESSSSVAKFAQGLGDVGEAFYERPGKTLGSTAKSVGPMLAGIPAGVVGALFDPVRAYKGVKKDYKRRYGKAGTEKNVRRIQEEGAIPEAADLASAIAGASRGASLTARTGVAGKRAQAVVTEPRPKLRTAPGVVRRQRESKGFAGKVVQRKVDKTRFEKQAERNRKVREDNDLERRHFERPEDVQGPETGVVTPVMRGTAKRARAMRFQAEQGVSRTRMRRTTADEVTRGSRKTEASLSKPERVAFAYAMEGHLPLKGTRAEKLAALDRLEQFFLAGRRETGSSPKGRRRRKYNDELPKIQYLKDHVDEALTPRLAEAVRVEKRRERRLTRQDPALASQQAQLARTNPQAEVLVGQRRGVAELERAENQLAYWAGRKDPDKIAKAQAAVEAARKAVEGVGAYQARAARARVQEGLPNPGYFKHQAEPFELRRSDYALGTGRHGPSAGTKTRTGLSFRTGQRDTRMEVLHQSRAKNIKRAEQWNFTIRNIEDNAIKEIRDAETGDMMDVSMGGTRRELLNAIDRSALDPDDVVLVRSGKLRKQSENLDGPGFEDDIQAGVAQQFKANSQTVEDARRAITDPDEVVNDGGWQIVPKEIADQQDAVASQGIAGRIVRKYVKGWPSKLLLGTNPSWALLQIVNNQLLAHLGGVGNVDLAKSAAFFKKHPDAKAQLDDYLGATTFEAERTGQKLGGASRRFSELQLVAGWRALKETPPMRTLGTVNPLDWFFRMDHANNTIHRRAVAYDFLRGEAYKEMGDSVAGFGAAMRRLEHTFDLGPEKQILELMKRPEVLEEAARHADDLLGNFSRYTPLERKWLEQNIMFYGFLRFSLRFTLYTLPVKHPIVANVVGNLSRLHEREVRKLLGLEKGDPLPPGVLAAYYIRDGKLKKNPVFEVPLARVNPTNNALTNMGAGPKALLLTLSPIWIAALNSAFHKDLFTGKAHRIEGESTPRETRENREKYPTFDFWTFAADLSKLIRPEHVAEDYRFRGMPQGSDSIPFIHERPTQYAFMLKPKREWTADDIELARSLRRQKREMEEKSLLDLIIEDQIPFIPRRSHVRERTEYFLEGLKGEKKKPKTLDERIEDRIGGSDRVDDLIDRRLEGSGDIDDRIDRVLGG